MEIKKLVASMTLEEKAGLCSGLNFWQTKPLDRYDIPSIMMTDGPHGLRKVASGPTTGDRPSKPATCFPPAVLSACSFDKELLYELGVAIGEEAEAENVRIVLGPGVNIKRSPLCGRNFEYFSEDPLLAGEMATAFIKGVQSKGIGTSLKHYAANNQETRRWSSDSVIDERTLREIYLPAFKKAVQEAKPATVMCSYNRLNGEYVSESRRFLTEILREEWGFDGIVVSDWGAVNDRVKGLLAGLDLEMPGAAEPSNDEDIIKAVKSGELDEAVLDLAVDRILRLICRFGGNEVCCQKYRCGEVRKCMRKPEGIDFDAGNAVARKIAAESMVLLKNDAPSTADDSNTTLVGATLRGRPLLPLEKSKKIAFIGEMAEKPRFQGAGSSQVNAYKITSALEAAAEYATVTYAKGYNTNDCDEVDEALQAEAVAAAEAADVCVVFIGLPPHYESEGYDRTHMRLPKGMNELVEAVFQANIHVVVVLSNGSPVEMPWADKVPVILEAYLGGQAGGAAVADILFGEVNPSGKLAESFPRKLSDNPSYLYYFGERDITEYREGVFVGYRYYDTKEMDILFPFGHGLSYNTYEYSNIKLSASKIKDTDTLTVTAYVENKGFIKGKEIVQLYVAQKDKDDRLIRPDKELRDFLKVSLAPRERKQISFTLDKSAFSYFNTELGDFHVLSGEYVIMLGKSSRDIPLQAVVHVESTVEIPFRANPNTTIRDIRRMPRGREFLQEVADKCPKQGYIAKESAEIGDPDYGYVTTTPECVLRQMRLMGTMPGITNEDIQKWMDERLND